LKSYILKIKSQKSNIKITEQNSNIQFLTFAFCIFIFGFSGVPHREAVDQKYLWLAWVIRLSIAL